MVDYAERIQAAVVVGDCGPYRTTSMSAMALTNKRLNPNVEVMFMMASAEHSFIGSV